MAEYYGVTLPRRGSNVYKVDGKDIIIQTRYPEWVSYCHSSLTASD